MSKDYYKILGVAKTSSDEEIKKAYRRLAHEFHPDKRGGNADKFKEINEAYQVLGSSEKRATYDRFGTADFSSTGGPFGGGNPFGGFSATGGPTGWDFDNINVNFGGDGGDVGDIFEAFFEGLGVKQKRRNYESGSDIELRESITLEEAFKGLKKTARIEVLTKCGVCGGRGYDEKAGTKKCAACAGRGEVHESRRTFFGNFSQVRTCAECHGTGDKPNAECRPCSGSGRITGTRDISFEIVPGISDGQIIKIKGGGEAGVRSAEAGDLYVRVQIVKHPVFGREGADLFVKKELNVVDALVGEKIAVRGIDGHELKVEIPQGFNLRERLRVRGEGMPNFHAPGRGDLYISFDVVTPKKVSAKAKNLLEDLRREL